MDQAQRDILRDKIVLLLTNGMTVEAADSFLVRQGQEPVEAARIVSDARKRITVAADFARDEQLGKAVMRLDDLYAKSIAAQDARTALQAQRELNRLLSLYGGEQRPDPSAPGSESDLAQRLELIASYLLPLALTADRYPVEEHARVAAEIIRNNGLAGVPQAQG